jgi:hypothetical protein
MRKTYATLVTVKLLPSSLITERNHFSLILKARKGHLAPARAWVKS